MRIETSATLCSVTEAQAAPACRRGRCLTWCDTRRIRRGAVPISHRATDGPSPFRAKVSFFSQEEHTHEGTTGR
jgi:hypothetical protein